VCTPKYFNSSEAGWQVGNQSTIDVGTPDQPQHLQAYKGAQAHKPTGSAAQHVVQRYLLAFCFGTVQQCLQGRVIKQICV